MPKINYEAMRIRIEFIYRLLSECNEEGFIRGYDAASFIAAIGLQLTSQFRIDGVFDMSHKASLIHHEFYKMIAPELNAITDKIKAESVNCIPVMALAKRELILKEGLDGIIEMAKGYFAAIEEGGVHA